MSLTRLCALCILAYIMGVSGSRTPSRKSLVYLKRPAATSEPPTPYNPAHYYVPDDYPKANSQPESTTAEPSTTTEQSSSTQSPTGEGDVQSHLEAIVKLLLQSKNNPRKFLILLPVGGIGKQTTTTTPAPTTPSPSTVKPKPRKKIKYIVMNS